MTRAIPVGLRHLAQEKCKHAHLVVKQDEARRRFAEIVVIQAESTIVQNLRNHRGPR